MSDEPILLSGVSAVSIDSNALILQGPPGAGKSSLALALIDRGAQLIGDDGVWLERDGERLLASPPPNTNGLLEVRNVGILEFPVAKRVPVALLLQLADDAERLPDGARHREIAGCSIPELGFVPGSIAPAIRAEWALRRFGTVIT